MSSKALTSPLEYVNARDLDINRCLKKSELYRETAKAVLEKTGATTTISPSDINLVERCLKRAAREESLAKRKSFHSSIVERILDLGQEAVSTRNLSKVIKVQGDLTRDKMNYSTDKAKSKMRSITEAEDKDIDFMGKVNDFMYGIDPFLLSDEAHEGLKEHNREEQILTEIFDQLKLDKPSLAAETLLKADRTKAVTLPEMILPSLPDVPCSIKE